MALVTDGRMSGASGKVPAAIHVTPEAAAGGAIARVQDGDMLRLDAAAGRLDVLVDPAAFAARTPAQTDLSANASGIGRELFAAFRSNVGPAESGCCGGRVGTEGFAAVSRPCVAGYSEASTAAPSRAG